MLKVYSRAAIAGLCLLLAGCADDDWSYAPPPGRAAPSVSGTTPPASQAELNYRNAMGGAQPANGRAALPNEACDQLATQRAEDAAAQGFDEDVQHEVHDRTYADCMAWSTKKTR